MSELWEDKFGVFGIEREELVLHGGEAEMIVLFGGPLDLPAGFDTNHHFPPSRGVLDLLDPRRRVEGLIRDRVPALVFIQIDQPAALQEVPDMLNSIIVFWICGPDEGVKRYIAFSCQTLWRWGV